MLDMTLQSILVGSFSMIIVLGLLYLFYPAITVAFSFTEKGTSKAIILKQAHTKSKKPLLSIIIPAYEEEKRLPKMIHEAYSYLCQPNCRGLTDLCQCLSSSSSDNKMDLLATVEWIVVSDGSKDRTSQVYADLVQKLSSQQTMTWKLINFEKNQGKGAAVRAGMLTAAGHFCLMVDADGATEFGPGLETVAGTMLQRSRMGSSQFPVVLGSRSELHADAAGIKRRRSIVRGFLQHCFHLCVVYLVGTADIHDTQCGFKLFPADAAKHLFGQLHLRRWAFDTELLYLAHQLNYPLAEVVVPWHEVDGSKLHTSALNLALVSASMFRDMVCVRLCYTLGLWRIRPKED
jgi:dolichyl-phosphate beta-glucosyltransferase